MKKKVFSIAVIALFALVILLPWGLSLAGADAEAGGGDAREIRSLAEFPHELSNDYFAKINAYVNDHSPMRNSIINLVTCINDGLNAFYTEKIVAPLMKADDNEPYAYDTDMDFGCVLSGADSAAAEHEHDYRVVRKQEASYQHDGYTLEKCSVCGAARVSGLKLRTELDGFYDGKTPVVYSGGGFAGIHDWYFYSEGNTIGYVQGDNVLSRTRWKSGKTPLRNSRPNATSAASTSSCSSARTKKSFIRNTSPTG